GEVRAGRRRRQAGQRKRQRQHLHELVDLLPLAVRGAFGGHRKGPFNEGEVALVRIRAAVPVGNALRGVPLRRGPRGTVTGSPVSCAPERHGGRSLQGRRYCPAPGKGGRPAFSSLLLAARSSTAAVGLRIICGLDFSFISLKTTCISICTLRSITSSWSLPRTSASFTLASCGMRLSHLSTTAPLAVSTTTL